MKAFQSVAFLALMGLASAFSGRHKAHEGMLQVPPSFARAGVHMYPALHPEHDPNDHRHLVPEDSKELYYSQEGHRREYKIQTLVALVLRALLTDLYTGSSSPWCKAWSVVCNFFATHGGVGAFEPYQRSQMWQPTH